MAGMKSIRVGCILRVVMSVALFIGEVHAQSFPIQDEPEGGIGFQRKMSLEQVAC